MSLKSNIALPHQVVPKVNWVNRKCLAPKAIAVLLLEQCLILQYKTHITRKMSIGMLGAQGYGGSVAQYLIPSITDHSDELWPKIGDPHGHN